MPSWLFRFRGGFRRFSLVRPLAELLSVDFMYLFMGKLGKWLSLGFSDRSQRAKGAKGYNYEVYTPFAMGSLGFQLVWYTYKLKHVGMAIHYQHLCYSKLSLKV